MHTAYRGSFEYSCLCTSSCISFNLTSFHMRRRWIRNSGIWVNSILLPSVTFSFSITCTHAWTPSYIKKCVYFSILCYRFCSKHALKHPVKRLYKIPLNTCLQQPSNTFPNPIPIISIKELQRKPIHHKLLCIHIAHPSLSPHSLEPSSSKLLLSTDFSPRASWSSAKAKILMLHQIWVLHPGPIASWPFDWPQRWRRQHPCRWSSSCQGRDPLALASGTKDIQIRMLRTS